MPFHRILLLEISYSSFKFSNATTGRIFLQYCFQIMNFCVPNNLYTTLHNANVVPKPPYPTFCLGVVLDADIEGLQQPSGYWLGREGKGRYHQQEIRGSGEGRSPCCLLKSAMVPVDWLSPTGMALTRLSTCPLPCPFSLDGKGMVGLPHHFSMISVYP